MPEAPPRRPLEVAGLAAGALEREGIESGRLEAELLLAHTLGVRRLDLYLQFERPLTPEEVSEYREAVRRRLRREPLQYITGEAGFRGLTLRVDRRVLIPRPETEILVETVLGWAASGGRYGTPGGGGTGEGGGATALDIGTGSGAIALSLAAEGGFGVVATDASADALDVARANAQACGVADRVELRHGALWSPLREGERFDVVVSNPPYIAEPERARLMPEVRDWEPSEALFAGADGLEVVRAIVAGAADRLREGGLLALELGVGQPRSVAALIEATGRFRPPTIGTDLTNRERVVTAVLASNANREGRD